MRPEQTILFSDLDGTLFSSAGVVSPENRAAIEAYIAAGGMFAVSTGREPRNALRFIGDLPQNAPAVVLNGAAVYDFAADEYLYCRFMERGGLDQYLRELLSAFPDLELQAYTPDGIEYCTPRQSAHPQLLALHEPCGFTTLDALGDKPFFKFFLYAPEEQDRRLTAFLMEGQAAGLFRHVPGTTDVGGRIAYHELISNDVSKGSALRYLRNRPEIEGRTILAAGDFWNDYELLEEADIAVAPSNAIPEIKALCRYIGVSNNEHLVKNILEDILPRI